MRIFPAECIRRRTSRCSKSPPNKALQQRAAAFRLFGVQRLSSGRRCRAMSFGRRESHMTSSLPPRPVPPPSSLDAPPAVTAWTAGIAAAVVAWGLAASQVILQRGFEAGDLAPFAFWSGLFGLGIAGLSRFLL